MELKTYLGGVGYRLAALGLAGLALVGLLGLGLVGKPGFGAAVAVVVLLLAVLAERQGRVVKERARMPARPSATRP
jgi:hypothetical protein